MEKIHEELFEEFPVDLTLSDLEWLLKSSDSRKSKKPWTEPKHYLYLRGCREYCDAYTTDGHRMHLVGYGNHKNIPLHALSPVGIELEVVRAYAKLSKQHKESLKFSLAYLDVNTEEKMRFAKMEMFGSKFLCSGYNGPNAFEVIPEKGMEIIVYHEPFKQALSQFKSTLIKLEMQEDSDKLSIYPEYSTAGIDVRFIWKGDDSWDGKENFKVKLNLAYLMDAISMRETTELSLVFQQIHKHQVTELSLDPVKVIQYDGDDFKKLIAVIMPSR